MTCLIVTTEISLELNFAQLMKVPLPGIASAPSKYSEMFQMLHFPAKKDELQQIKTFNN